MKNLFLSALAVGAFTLTANAQTDAPAVSTVTTGSTTTNPNFSQLPVVEEGLPSFNLPGMNTVSADAPTAPLTQGFGTETPSEYNGMNTTESVNTMSDRGSMTTPTPNTDMEEPEDGLSDDLPFLDDEDYEQDKELFGDGEERDAMERNNTDGVEMEGEENERGIIGKVVNGTGKAVKGTAKTTGKVAKGAVKTTGKVVRGTGKAVVKGAKKVGGKADDAADEVIDETGEAVDAVKDESEEVEEVFDGNETDQGNDPDDNTIPDLK